MEAYYALVERLLRYENVVWGSVSDAKMEALQQQQTRAFDIIDSSRLKDSWEHRSLNVNQLMNFDRLGITYKILNNLYPETLQNKFQERFSISKYNTRNSRNIHFLRPNLECVKKSLLYTGIREWNGIPQPIRDARSTIAFRRSLKTHFRAEKNKLQKFSMKHANLWKSSGFKLGFYFAISIMNFCN